MEPAVVAAEIGELARERGGGEDIRPGRVGEPEPPGPRIERHEPRGVRRADVHGSVAHRGSPVHPGLARRVVPLLAARGSVERVHVRIATADVHGSVHHRGRGLEADLVVVVRVHAGLECPFLLAAFGVDGVELAVPAADIDRVPDDGGRGVHDITGRELPLQHAALRVDGVNVAVAAAEVDLAVRDRGRGGEHIPGIGNRLPRGRVAVQTLCLELALVLDGVDPPGLPVGGVDRGQRARRGDEIDRSGIDGRRGGNRPARLEVPLLLAGRLVDRVQVPAHARDVDHAVRDRGRGHDRSPSLERPLDARRLRRTRALVDAGPRDVAVEGGLGQRRR